MTLTVHALLHVADTIETIGPVWTWWSFPIERQCGRFQQKIKSRRHPFANLDNFLLEDAKLKQITMIYNLSNADLAIGDCAASKKRAELVLEDKCRSEILTPRQMDAEPIQQMRASRCMAGFATKSSCHSPPATLCTHACSPGMDLTQGRSGSRNTSEDYFQRR
jgi:hypothetical protein